jgi:hypothetical protein
MRPAIQPTRESCCSMPSMMNFAVRFAGSDDVSMFLGGMACFPRRGGEAQGGQAPTRERAAAVICVGRLGMRLMMKGCLLQVTDDTQLGDDKKYNCRGCIKNPDGTPRTVRVSELPCVHSPPSSLFLPSSSSFLHFLHLHHLLPLLLCIQVPSLRPV